MTTTLMLMSFEHLSQSVNQSTKSSPALRFLIEGFQIHFNHALELAKGHLISKAIYGVLDSPKKPTKKI